MFRLVGLSIIAVLLVAASAAPSSSGIPGLAARGGYWGLDGGVINGTLVQNKPDTILRLGGADVSRNITKAKLSGECGGRKAVSPPICSKA
jgi:hypothetical protein